ncbi:hypothetical protein ACOSQ3_001962 [Xanthoceras sorbifolium]
MHGPECAHTHRHTAACVLLLYLFLFALLRNISSNFKIIKQVDLGWVPLRANKGSTGHLSLALGSCREIIVLLVPLIEAV